MQNFEKIIKLLLENKVKFVLIGGFAATVHGVSILTQDIDICIPFNKENLENILKAFNNINPLHRENKKALDSSSEKLSKFKNLYLSTDLGYIDMLGQVSNLGTYRELIDNTIEINLFGHKCKVLDVDTLIKSKQSMNRPKDLEAIIQLKAIKEKIH